MPPRFKRKRQTSRTTSNVRTSQDSGSNSGRFKRPSVPSQSSSLRRHLDHDRTPASTRSLTSQGSAPFQAPPQHDVNNDDEANEDLEQVVMAIDRQQKGAIGCAYYAAREERLYCLQDVANGSLQAIETCESFHMRYEKFGTIDPSQ